MESSPKSLSPDDLSRFSRHLVLPQIGLKGQSRLKQSRVLIIGLGGLGSPAALYLAAAGVGTLGLCDFDRVELHNLQRQIIHDTAAVGSRKIESAAQRLRNLYPGINLHLHPDGIQPHNALELLSGYDLVLDGSDNFGTRYLVNDASALAGKPLAYGSIFQFEGQVSFFHPARGFPCYRCLFPRPPEPGTVPNCEEAGVFGALCGIVGSLQAMESIKWLAGVGEPLAGRLLVIDALSMVFRTLNLKADPDCPLCGKSPKIRDLTTENYAYDCQVNPESSPPVETIDPLTPPAAIDVEQAAHLLQDRPEDVVLLDVREPYEREICAIEGSLHLPMGKVPDSRDQLPRDRTLLIYCHHGGRSGQVTHFLRTKGFSRVANVEGGIDAWARLIEPGMRRY